MVSVDGEREELGRRRTSNLEVGLSDGSGLCDLHLGVDGAAEGSDDHAAGDLQPAAVDAGSSMNCAAGMRVLQKTPFSFDASVWEFFGRC